MNDEEDFDEFPSIAVNSSQHELSSFSMPSAGAVAAARARADATERELLQLRADHARADRECAGRGAGAALGAQSDSSGSEGEAALAVAAGALRVRTAPPAPPPPLPVLLPALARQLPAGGTLFIDAYMAVLRDGSGAAVHALTRELGAAVRDMLGQASAAPEAAPWSADEALGVGAWLCAVGAGAGAGARGQGPSRRDTLRTLHLLIDDVATDQQVEAISGLLSASVLEEGAALELSDALRSGSTRGDALARAVARRALASLAGLAPAQDRSMRRVASLLPAAWRHLSPPRQYLALQLLARLVPVAGEECGEEDAEGDVARALLDALAHPAPSHRTQSTDTLKVLVAATKLQVLFHLKK